MFLKSTQLEVYAAWGPWEPKSLTAEWQTVCSFWSCGLHHSWSGRPFVLRHTCVCLSRAEAQSQRRTGRVSWTHLWCGIWQHSSSNKTKELVKSCRTRTNRLTQLQSVKTLLQDINRANMAKCSGIQSKQVYRQRVSLYIVSYVTLITIGQDFDQLTPPKSIKGKYWDLAQSLGGIGLWQW